MGHIHKIVQLKLSLTVEGLAHVAHKETDKGTDKGGRQRGRARRAGGAGRASALIKADRPVMVLLHKRLVKSIDLLYN